jgi:hypothetical protein
MYYSPSNNSDPIHHNYKKYDLCFVNEIDDNDQNILIVPETQTILLKNYVKSKIFIWWLSVDNYFLYLPGLKGRINRLLLNRFNSTNYLFFNSKLYNIDFHLAQSEYAVNFLNNKGINNVGLLSDYLHESYLKVNTDLGLKQNIVAYNPKKGISFTKKLIKKYCNINFVPIKNMTREDVVDLLQKAKVYIDFGFHPGKDRIPREAAILGCCVITNKQGSANFFKDIPINEEFKFENEIYNLLPIKDKIEDIFNNYIDNLAKFENYRIEIINQELEFNKQFKDIFLG